jgi:low-affinity ferrous iron transport protein
MQTRNRFIEAICSIGARREFECAAPTQVVMGGEKDGIITDCVENINTYTVTAKARLLDRWLDNVVEYSGSQLMFFAILGGLLILGIPGDSVRPCNRLASRHL